MTIESTKHKPTHEPAQESGGSSGFVGRPPFQLRSLPVHLRWEVTRRHPYYQTLWQLARAYHRDEPLVEAADPCLREMSVIFLAAIGVQGEPPDPATRFNQLGGGPLASSWLSGAVHPVSMQGLAGILLSNLPKEALGLLGGIFLAASRDDIRHCPPRRVQSLMDLAKLNSPGLENISAEPFVSINPAASKREITKSLNGLLKQWKGERGLREQRVPVQKIEKYLEIWDRREGWGNGTYDRSQEQTLIDLAKSVKRSISTVDQQYKSAFELITGNDYSPELFRVLFGALKFSDFDVRPLGKVARRRPLTTRKPKLVTESQLFQSDNVLAGLVRAAPDTSGDDAQVDDYFKEIEIRLRKGHSDQQIVEDLDLPRKFLEAVASLRRRLADGLLGSSRRNK